MCVHLLAQASNQWAQQTSRVVQWRPQCPCQHRAAKPTTSTQQTCATHHSRYQFLSSPLSNRYAQTSTVGTSLKNSENEDLVHLTIFFTLNSSYNSSTSPHHWNLLPFSFDILFNVKFCICHYFSLLPLFWKNTSRFMWWPCCMSAPPQ
jgi:hypothetical protein